VAHAQEYRALSHVLDRLTHGHEHHGQRWELHVPREGESPRSARPLLATLGLPTFGLAFAISVLTTYGPVVLIRLTDSTSQVGALIGAEGAFALVVPLVSGAVSDRLPGSPAARRFPFVLLGAPLIVGGLILLPFSDSIAIAAVAATTRTTRRIAPSTPICCHRACTLARRRVRLFCEAPVSARRCSPAGC
jgi:hypothetical protein